MKFEMDKEMDRLLRAQVMGGAMKDISPMSEDHLDTDELSAFAENTLSPAARARYSVHLADCDRCRGIIVSLNGAANVAGELEKNEKAILSPVSLDERQSWLNRLFSFATLRYALPVLAFMVIGGIIWRAYEAPRADRSLAEVGSATAIKSEQPALDRAETAQTNSGQTAPREMAENKKAGHESQKKAGDIQDSKTNNTIDGPAPQSPAASAAPPPPSVAAKQSQVVPQQDDVADKAKEQSEKSKTAGVAERSEVTGALAQPQAAAKTSPNEDARGTEASGRRQEPTQSSEQAANSAPAPMDSTPRRRALAKPAPGGAGGNQKDDQKNQSATSQRASARDEEAEAASVESRTIGGRRFRRRGGIWMDAAYASGSATLSVRRGSEQYRALIADEPGLRSIIEQLNGIVIVVWKGRAYRFH